MISISPAVWRICNKKDFGVCCCSSSRSHLRTVPSHSLELHRELPWLWHLNSVKGVRRCCSWLPVWTSVEGALHLSHGLWLCWPWQSPLLGLLCLCSQLSSLQLGAGHHSSSPVQEQDTAVLFLPLTVLKIALLHEPCWCPLKGVSDFYLSWRKEHVDLIIKWC